MSDSFRPKAKLSSSAVKASSTVGRPTATAGLHHTASLTSVRPTPAPPPRLTASRSVVGLDRTSSPTPRIRSKVTVVPSSPTTSSPTSLRPPQPQFYPITTSAPAANPHRFAPPRPASTVGVTPRTSPSAASHVYQSFASSSSSVSPTPRARALTTTTARIQSQSQPTSPPSPAASAIRFGSNVSARVVLKDVPSPIFQPHSPSASSLSVSSRSSASFLEPSSHQSNDAGYGYSQVQGQGYVNVNGYGPQRAQVQAHSRTGSASSGSRNGGGSAINGFPGSASASGSGPPNDLRATLDNLIRYTTSSDDGSTSGVGVGSRSDDRRTPMAEEEDGERKVKAAAKSDRKIADLEITNRSLLAINASLEATKHKQAKEIHELRRRLRETRLILPPRTFRALKLKQSEGVNLKSEGGIYSDRELGLEDEDEEDEEEDGEEDEDDAVYRRVRLLLDALLHEGQAALDADVRIPPTTVIGSSSGVEASTTTDPTLSMSVSTSTSAPVPAPAKVLSAAEVADWHGGGDDGESVGDESFMTTSTLGEELEDDDEDEVADEDDNENMFSADVDVDGRRRFGSGYLDTTRQDDVGGIGKAGSGAGPTRLHSPVPLRPASPLPPIRITQALS